MKFAEAARLWDNAYDGGVASAMLGRAPRAVPRKSRCAGQGCRVARVRGYCRWAKPTVRRAKLAGEGASPSPLGSGSPRPPRLR